MRGYEAAQILKAKGVTAEDVAEEIIYRKETNAFSNNPKNEAADKCIGRRSCPQRDGFFLLGIQHRYSRSKRLDRRR